jgi:hypothetical protein
MKPISVTAFHFVSTSVLTHSRSNRWQHRNTRKPQRFRLPGKAGQNGKLWGCASTSPLPKSSRVLRRSARPRDRARADAGGSRDRDPVIESFLSFLAEDMVRFPKQIKPLDPAVVARIDALVGHLPFNRTKTWASSRSSNGIPTRLAPLRSRALSSAIGKFGRARREAGVQGPAGIFVAPRDEYPGHYQSTTSGRSFRANRIAPSSGKGTRSGQTTGIGSAPSFHGRYRLFYLKRNQSSSFMPGSTTSGACANPGSRTNPMRYSRQCWKTGSRPPTSSSTAPEKPRTHPAAGTMKTAVPDACAGTGWASGEGLSPRRYRSRCRADTA